MEKVMTAVSGAMVDEEEGGFRRLDTIGSARIVEICESALGTSGLDLGRAVSVSLLIPTAVRHRGEVPVRFTHRASQEYFLARHLVEEDIVPDCFPVSVREFYADLAQR